MQSFTVTLPEKRRGHVINKRSGIRRPSTFFFVKYRNRERIIAYTVIVDGPAGKNEFILFKTHKEGRWLNGARKNGENVVMDSERKVSRALKSAIDEFENKRGEHAYQELF